MPSPVVSHVIGTMALLGAAIVLLAAFSFIEYVRYMDSVNLMLAEVAEAAARELVELVSVYTLGGSGASYMVLTAPDTLGGQPYLLRITGGGNNVLNVTAQLQVYRQVRVVVMPNFGRYPVKAVSEAKTVSARGLSLQVAPYLYVPLPAGHKPAIVAYRASDSCDYEPDPTRWTAICVGFAAMPEGKV